ncbi:MAG: SurA N-terminal domain-containing protein [Pseudomonadota bacterium]
MIQAFRDKIASWITYVIIGVLILAFGFWGIERLFGVGGNASVTVAKIDGQEITQFEFNRTYERLKRELAASMGRSFTYTSAIEKKLKQNAIQSIINNTILTQHALEQGYRITPQQVDSVLTRIPQFQVNGRFSQAKFAQMLDQLLFTPAGFINDLKTKMLYQQMQSAFLITAFVLPQDLQNAYDLIKQKRNIEYMMIPTKKFLASIDISASMLKDYYTTHQDKFKLPERVSIRYVILDLAGAKKNVKVSETQLKNYYEDNLDNFTIPKKWHFAQILVRSSGGAKTDDELQTKLNSIGNQLKQGLTFSAAVKKYSDDIASKKRAGVMPWVTLNMLSQPIAQTLEKLTPGQISAPVKTQYGYMIIKLLAVEPEKIKPFAQVKPQVKTALINSEAEKLFADETSRLSNLTYSNPDSLVDAAKDLTLKIETSPLFSRQGGKTALTRNPKVIQAAFSRDVLQNRYNSNVINLAADKVMVLRVNEHKQATVKPFAEVKAQIKKLLTDEKATALTKVKGEDIIKSITAGKPLAEIAKTQGYKLVNKSGLTRQTTDINRLILLNTFSLPADAVNKVKGFSLKTGDYVVLKLIKVEQEKLPVDEQKQYQAFKRQISAIYGLTDFDLYLKQLVKQAKVKIDKDINVDV